LIKGLEDKLVLEIVKLFLKMIEDLCDGAWTNCWA